MRKIAYWNFYSIKDAVLRAKRNRDSRRNKVLTKNQATINKSAKCDHFLTRSMARTSIRRKLKRGDFELDRCWEAFNGVGNKCIKKREYPPDFNFIYKLHISVFIEVIILKQSIKLFSNYKTPDFHKLLITNPIRILASNYIIFFSKSNSEISEIFKRKNLKKNIPN